MGDIEVAAYQLFRLERPDAGPVSAPLRLELARGRPAPARQAGS
jgi:hypothetical protein